MTTQVEVGPGPTGVGSGGTLRDVLWTLPQPAVALGGMLAVASAIATGWVDPDLLTTLILLAPIPTLLIAERLLPKRRDWLLDRREFAEDLFWVASVYFIWFPIYADYYDTPVSEAFAWLRAFTPVEISLEAGTTSGLLGAALVAIFASEFIYYWLHRLQHRVMFFWRMHATHHHVTKMSAARSDRTHPLEFLALNLGPAVTLGLLGVSDDVLAVVLAFKLPTAYMNHCNLPLRSGVYGWLFTTAEWHQLHHSLERSASDTNFGCAVILYDRLFGTFSGKTQVARVGNGTGRALSILTQLSIPFRSDEVLKRL